MELVPVSEFIWPNPPATHALEKADFTFTVRNCDYDSEADEIGVQAAEAFGEARWQIGAAARSCGAFRL